MNIRAILFLCFGALVAVSSGCQIHRASVRKVDFSETPEMKELAERARRVGNQAYPKILALLADEASKPPRRLNIIFKKQLPGNVGQTVGNTISLRADWFGGDPADLEIILVHEMTHVAQQCGPNTPIHWAEGIADYVCFKFGYTNAASLPECSEKYPHYTSGYCCTGAFLLYLDKTYGSALIRQLNTGLRRGSYSEDVFAKATGKGLAELWSDFQKTPAFTPAAAEVNRIIDALGYLNGQPPTNIAARVWAYVEQQPGGELTLEAVNFLKALLEQNQLPGPFKDEQPKQTSNFSLHVDLLLKESSSSAYPARRTLYGRKHDDPSTYHYTVVRQSKDSAWKLQRAWRTSPDGRLLHEYPVQ